LRVLARDLRPGQDYLLQFRTNDGMNVSQWSPVYKLKTAGDVTPPGDVEGLTWIATGESFIATWIAPTLDGPDAFGNRKSLRDLKDYEIIVRANGKSQTYNTINTTFDFTLVMNAQAFDGIELTVEITIKARDLSGNKSPGVTKTATEETPPTPTAPIVDSTMGKITVEWDGQTSAGTINPFNLQYVEIHAFTLSGFTPSDSTIVGRFEPYGKQGTIVSALSYDTVYYFRLVSVNRKGKKSPPSGQASGTPTRLSGLEIDPNAKLSANQMNFTARELGGANAFYGTTLPTTQAAPDGTAYKPGDVFFNTASPPATNSGKTYRRSATGTWVEDTSIGVISGRKLIANTVTSDAVGTNLLITSKANIGTAVIDAANIASVNAATITTGELKSSVMANYNGIAQPLWSVNLTGRAVFNEASVIGQLVVGSSTSSQVADNAKAVIRSYNYIPNTAGWTINGDGTVEFGSATLRGSFRTNVTGRRVEIMSGGIQGVISFFSPAGALARVQGYTASLPQAGVESLSMNVPLNNSWYGAWNSIQIQSNDAIFTVSKDIRFTYGGDVTNGTFRIDHATDRGTVTTPPQLDARMIVDEANGTRFYDNGNRLRIWLSNDGGLKLYDGDDIGNVGDTRFAIANDNTYIYGPAGPNNSENRGQIEVHRAETVIRARTTVPGDGSSMRILESGIPGSSVKLVLQNRNGFGGIMKYYYLASDAGGERMEFRNVQDTGNIPVWGTGFIGSSDRSTKEDIQDISFDALEVVKKMRTREFYRKGHKGEAKNAGVPPMHQIGFVTDEMPLEVVRGNPDPKVEGPSGVDVIAVIAALVGSIQTLEQRIAELEK